MEGYGAPPMPPDDLLQSDMRTFPAEDPATVARRAQLQAQADKLEKQQQAEAEKARKKEEAMVKKAMAMPPKQAQAGADMKAIKHREMMAHKIRLYFKCLSHRLSVKEPKVLPKDDEGLAELLASIETELQSRGGIEGASKVFLGGAFLVEQVNQQFDPLGLKLSGPVASLSGSLAANRKEWDDLITEFAISNAEWFIVGPGKRLIAFVVQMGQAVHAANTAALNGARPPTKEEMKETEDL